MPEFGWRTPSASVNVPGRGLGRRGQGGDLVRRNGKDPKMRKLCMLLAVAVALCFGFAPVGCSKEDTPKTEEKKEENK